MYQIILHATDLSDAHFHWCQQALAIAKRFDAELYLLHVIEPPASLQLAQGLGFAEFDYPVKEDAEAVLNTVGEALQIPASHLFVEVGSIKNHTLEKIKTLDADLLIIGSHTPDHLPAFLGTTAHSIIEAVPCDILTLKK
jgi:universal stress protein A